ncbi:MAG: hypothetical protein IH621_08105, partial [Krumholzibacteria bacterium]|nr:hypothetical protein [Candidatus Krumholzibacteria bacterium]
PTLRDRAAAPPVHWLPATVEAATVRSDAAAVPAALAEALAVYGRHDTGAAIPALEALELDAGWASLRDLYLLSALANAGRVAAAETVLVRLDAATLPHGPRHEAWWYRYVLLTRTGRQDEARSLLGDLEGVEGEIGDLARAERRRLEAGAQGKP